MLTAKERVVGILTGQPVDRIACFSGMGNITLAGLEQLGYRFQDLHTDPKKMADMAASSYKLFGYECAIVPFDLCVEAEVLGCIMNAYEEVQAILYPTIKEKVIHSEEDMANLVVPEDLSSRGRVPLICQAIQYLKEDIGDQVAIGSYLLGPFTLAGQLMDLNDLFKLSFKKPKLVGLLLDRLADVIIKLAAVYRQAGIDYICIREMGATTDILSPRSFKAIIQPYLKKIAEAIDYPKVLHICGGTNQVISLMNECGYDAVSIEAKNDIIQSRSVIGPEPLVFGAMDGFNVLVNGTVDDVKSSVLKDIEAGVDAIWPGCDIWPAAKPENIKAMVEATVEYGSKKWKRK